MNSSRHTSAVGTAYCVLSAIVYAGFYVCQGDVAESLKSLLGEVPSALWITCVQAGMAALLLGIYLVGKAACGRRVFPGPRQMLILAALGLLGQVGGVILVWAMSLLGAGPTTVLSTAIMLAVSAVLGLVVLGERVSWTQIAAMTIIAVSVACFNFGAKSEDSPAAGAAAGVGAISATDIATPPPKPEPAKFAPKRDIFFGIVLAALSAVAFAALSVGIRKMVTGDTRIEIMVFFLNVMGPIVLGPWCLLQIGPSQLMQTPARDLGIMILSGPLNLIALLLVTVSFRFISVVRVNVINNGLCAALTMLAGIVFYGVLEKFMPEYLILGMALSFGGIVLICLGDPNQGAADPAAQPSANPVVDEYLSIRTERR
jgi:drug/metabolite transporter (DMT)-like permease